MINTARIAAEARAANEVYLATIAPTLERAAFWKRMLSPPQAADIATLNQWVTFRYELEGNKKVPLSRKGHKSDYTNSKNHMLLTEAVALCQNNPRKHHGVGFVFTGEGGYVGIDSDRYKLTRGTVVEQIVAWAEQFPTMRMRSLSGLGQHLYVKVTDPAVLLRLGAQRQHLLGAIEIYHTNGFFACTFDMLNDLPIAEGSALVTYILDEHERHVAKLPAVTSGYHPTVPLVIADEADLLAKAQRLVDQAVMLRPDLKARIMTPIDSSAAKGAWSLTLRNVVSDLAKPGVLNGYQPEPLRELIWAAIVNSPLVNQSFDDPAKGETRPEKARRLLHSASWWRKILDSNAAMKILPKP